MSRRQLNTVEQSIRRISDQLAQLQVRRAFLLTAYPGTQAQGAPRVVSITFSDPSLGGRGTMMRARIRPGLTIGAAAIGSPVGVRIRHGQIEILSFG